MVGWKTHSLKLSSKKIHIKIDLYKKQIIKRIWRPSTTSSVVVQNLFQYFSNYPPASDKMIHWWVYLEGVCHQKCCRFPSIHTLFICLFLPLISHLPQKVYMSYYFLLVPMLFSTVLPVSDCWKTGVGRKTKSCGIYKMRVHLENFIPTSATPPLHIQSHHWDDTPDKV